MGEKTLNNSLRLEVNDPRGSTDWRPLWGLDGERCEEDQVLADMLNQIIAPVRVRIVPGAD
jgi:hypothetical protein